MDAPLLLFWKPGPGVKFSAAEIARELLWGEDVEGLIDLPIREMIDRLKVEFPDHEERSGVLIGRSGSETFEATWTWQHLRVDCRGLTDADRQRLIDAMESFDCMAYEPHKPDA